ncbi:hypothetical protein AJ79_01940 [Helicocarpus griseus UAMH5409]|uniref:Uncharacterized protein n=1 Tax=Helicocarpus griseus UAMH5409 TaxID=1447875 RepID=A0A2B7Y593_9EURO|nr:hypothetical protein AJ79_01940 [Helicocarpus griseus UAMH5409]
MASGASFQLTLPPQAQYDDAPVQEKYDAAAEEHLNAPTEGKFNAPAEMQSNTNEEHHGDGGTQPVSLSNNDEVSYPEGGLSAWLVVLGSCFGSAVTLGIQLHLTWAYEVVFIKPLPKYLLSALFWQFYFGESSPISDERQREVLCRAAKGFLRSYSYLIQHKSDFLIAADERTRLIPKNIRFSDFMLFISQSQGRIDDADDFSRYYFGELHLTRLNFWAKIFLGHVTYHKLHGNYSARLGRYYVPLLFVFAAVTTVLSAMQVAMSAYPAM